MSLGSEHFLGMSRFRDPEDDLYDGSDEFNSSSQSSRTGTETNEEQNTEIQDIESHHMLLPKEPLRPNNKLMALLSGKQVPKKKPRKSEKTAKNQSLGAASDNVDLAQTPLDDTEVSSTESWYSNRPDTNINDAHSTEPLNTHSSARPVSVKDLFKTFSTPTQGTPDNDKFPSPVEIVDISPPYSSKSENSEDLALEHNEFHKLGRSINARDLFTAFPPKKIKRSDGRWSLKVKLKINPEKLAKTRENANVFVTLGNSTEGCSFTSTIMRRKTSLKVTLKLPSNVLKETSKLLNPLYTRSSGNADGRDASSVFAMMMKSATHHFQTKEASLKRIKGIELPNIPRTHLHVYLEDLENPEVSLTGLKRKNSTENSYTFNANEVGDVLTSGSTLFLDTCLPSPQLKYEVSESYNRDDLLWENAPLAFTSRPHSNLLSIIKGDKPSLKSQLNWPQRFQPQDTDSLLLDEKSRQFMKEWMFNAFDILATQSTKTPRNIKIREVQKRQRQKESSISDFIVDDDYDESLTDEDVFVPILIISGEYGSCKSAAVYAAMDEMNGYIYEVNAGQPRARKDLYSSLKEFCTTQIVHQTNEEGSFQKGLVLFEDCDILFEQDKTFWSIVQDVINFSRRPIVVTVREISAIPKNIWELAREQDSIISLAVTSVESTRQYLYLCSFACGFDVAPKILDEILKNCQNKAGYDLRKALMTCQWICCKCSIASNMLIRVTRPQLDTNDDQKQDLEELARSFDTLSVSDVLEHNSHSSILHDVRPNELLDLYFIDDSNSLRQPTLPYELNSGLAIKSLLEHNERDQFDPKCSFNRIRNTVLDFVCSRSRKLPKFLRDLRSLRSQTRSKSMHTCMEEVPETQGLPDSSICYSMNNLSFLIDLAPIARYWARLQKSILTVDSYNRSCGNGSGSVEDFLNWRRFHHNVEEVINTISNDTSKDYRN